MPIYPPRPMNVAIDAIKYDRRINRGCTPLFLCRYCKQRRPYRFFYPPDLCRSKMGVCKPCKALGRVDRSVFRPRLKYAVRGVMYFLCSPCGRYKTQEFVDEDRIAKRRALCHECHRQEYNFNAHRRDFTHSIRNFGSMRRVALVCRKCGYWSAEKICAGCRLGVPPISAMALGNVLPMELANHNIGSIVSSLLHIPMPKMQHMTTTMAMIQDTFSTSVPCTLQKAMDA